jgi:hypothetical protein
LRGQLSYRRILFIFFIPVNKEERVNYFSLFFHKAGELFDGETAGTYEASQCALGNFPMIRDGECGHVPLFDEDHVTAALPHHMPIVFGEYLDDIAPAKYRQ